MTLRAGVVAVQGDVSEHADAVRRAAAAHGEREGRRASNGSSEQRPRDDVEVVEIRESGLVPDCDVLLMPGGESTTISRLVHREGIAPEIRAHVDAGKPMLATCAGLIVAARDAKDDRVETLGLLDVTIDRNAFGRQTDSFEAPLPVRDLEEPFPAVFIRAPAIDEVGSEADRGEASARASGKTASDDVEVLAEWNGRPVAVRQGPVVGTSFHPELTGDSRIHELAFFEERAVTG